MGDASANGDLHGWKEIATYLGKSVRAVQRWEQELGLPVRRLKTQAGQTVFARRAELDAWIARQAVPPREVAEEASSEHPAASISPMQPTTARGPYWIAAGLVLLVSAAALIGAARLGSGSSPAASSYRLTDRGLQGLHDGQVLWTHDFGHPLREALAESVRANMGRQIKTADLDGDGRPEVLVMVSYATENGYRSDEIHCFSPDGTLRWTFAPDFTLRFRAGIYEPPWIITDFLTTPGASGTDLWVSVSHSVWWPAAVVRINAAGEADLRYVQSGGIYALAAWQTLAGRRIVAAGINNELSAATVALLDPAGRAARSPQTRGSAYECMDCPTALPPTLFALPRTDVNEVDAVPYNRVNWIHVAGGILQFQTVEFLELGGASMLYRVNDSLEVETGGPSDGFWTAHRRLEQQGLLDHDARACPERQRELPVRVFDRASGWRDLMVRNTAAPLPGAR
jgi:hypothetical protein